MKKIGVIGLGYVGLPLAVTLAGKYAVTGFDINKARVAGLQKGHDHTQEVSDQELQGAHDALIAFEGYGSNGPMLHASALQRPAGRRSGTWVDRLVEPIHQLLAAFSRRN